MLSSIHLFVQVDATKATDGWDQAEGMKDPVQLNLVLGTQKKIMRHEMKDNQEQNQLITFVFPIPQLLVFSEALLPPIHTPESSAP